MSIVERMNKFFGYFMMTALLFTACGTKETERLPNERLVALLADIHVAEAAMQQAQSATKDSLADLYYEQVYRIHKITGEQLNSELQYLQSHPEVAEEVYGKVIELLNERDLRGGNKEKEEDKKK